MDDVGSSSESEVEWEDVEPLAGSSLAHHGEDDEPGTSASAASLEIVLQGGASLHKGKRKSKQQFLEKMIAAFNKELQCHLHKVHLLCLLAHGLRLSSQCDNQLLQSVLLSLLPREHLHSNTELYNQDSLLKTLKWFATKISQLTKHVETTLPESEFQSLTGVQLLVALLRAIGLRTRLVLALNPVSFKPASVKSGRKSSEGSPAAGSRKEPVRKKSGDSSGAIKEGGSSEDVQMSTVAESAKGGSGKAGKNVKDVSVSDVMVEGEPPTESRVRKRKAAAGSQTKRRTSKRLPSAEGDTSYNQRLQDEGGVIKGDHASSSQRGRGKRSRRKGKARLHQAGTGSPYFKKSLKSQLEEDVGVESYSNSDSDFVPETQSSKVKIGRHIYDDDDDDDSDDFDDKPKGKRRRKRSRGRLSRGSEGTSPPLAKKLRLAADENINSSSKVSRRKSEDDPGRRHQDPSEAKEEPDEPKSGELYGDTASWVEVYVQSRRQWKSVHLPSLSVGQPQLCEKHCSQPLNYIIGIENARAVCDVTARYASHWCTHVRKQRLSEPWWAETLAPFSPSREEKEEEEEDFLAILYARPFPTSISEYKGHPLYALRRHLLKFEAIYPEDTKILGSCRGEPIYAREHVCTLHTRETWLKEGRVVKALVQHCLQYGHLLPYCKQQQTGGGPGSEKGEKPYKIVKARPKKGQSVLEAQNSTVETFGWWQTEEYVPPPVVDGKVPRNEYGNVELFQPSMLPPGACHIKIQGIQRVARKLGIDFAPAMMGWDFHSGYCHPILEGIVVGKEYEEVLLEAWEQEEQVLIEKEMKKREQRVLENWRKLTRGLLIRERVKRRYKLS